ncbi:MAG: hypothetical protein METHAR1v1_1490004 [Methanothrix sp.]|jgi:hypothetical protein|nr:MAG: hypothetical protein METHAR1v1_1490004 [Methanothrix sp.]
MPVAGSASFGGDGTDLGADFPVRGNIFDIFIILNECSRRRRRLRRPGAAAHPKGPKGIRPPTRRRQRGRQGSGARGRRCRGFGGEAGRRSRAPEAPPETRACGIGVGLQASYPPRSDEVQGIEMPKTNAVLTSEDCNPVFCRSDATPAVGGGAKGGLRRRRSRQRQYFDIFIIVKEYSLWRRPAGRPPRAGQEHRGLRP